MKSEQDQSTALANKLFPDVEADAIRLVTRLAWFRYSFFILSTSLFVLLFVFSVIFFSFQDKLTEAEGLVSLAGVVVSPLIPLLYYVRYRRGGFLVTSDSLYLKEGFFFEKTTVIALHKIKSAKRIKEKRMNLPAMGHIELQLKGGEQRFLLDVSEPQALLGVLQKG